MANGPPQAPGELPTEAHEAEEVLALLARLERESQGRTPALQTGCAVGTALFLGAFSICAISTLTGVWMVVGIAAAALAIIGLFRLTVTEAQQEIVAQLTRHGDVRIVPALITALTWPDMERHRSTVAAALAKLLPRFKASDSPLLNDRHRAILYRWLRRADSNLHIPILRAFEQIGDEKAVGPIERIARRRARTPRAQEVQSAAQDALMAIRTRGSAEGMTLLRAAEPAGDEVLLRPAGDIAQKNAEHLLRPIADTEDVDQG